MLEATRKTRCSMRRGPLGCQEYEGYNRSHFSLNYGLAPSCAGTVVTRTRYALSN